MRPKAFMAFAMDDAGTDGDKFQSPVATAWTRSAFSSS
jgi:hypothetical protein